MQTDHVPGDPDKGSWLGFGGGRGDESQVHHELPSHQVLGDKTLQHICEHRYPVAPEKPSEVTEFTRFV